MTAVRSFLIIIAIIALACTAFGQSVYFDGNKGGFGVAASYSTNENLNGFALTVGGASKGNFDSQFTIGRFTSDRVTMTALGFGLAYYPVKSGPRSLVGTGLVAGLQHDKVSVDGYWSDYSASATAVTVGMTLYMKANLSPKASLYPFIGGHYLGVIDGGGDGTGVFEAGVSISKRTSERAFLILTPGITVDREYVTFSFELGMAFQSGPTLF